MESKVPVRVALGSDHAGFQLKERVRKHLDGMGVIVADLGVDGPESADYPEPAHRVASAVELGSSDLGVLICGSGNGVNMVANKHKNVRAALAWNEEIATLARQHNNANVVSLPARFVAEDAAIGILEAFLAAEFEGGRHQRRVAKIEPTQP